MTTPCFTKGFSLIELAIVLFIVALLLGGLLVPLTAQIDQQRAKETQKTLADVKEALIGFAILNGRLPCPATAISNGIEKFTGAIGTTPCTTYFSGFVPASTLGMAPVNNQGLLIDGWNNPIRYAVSDVTLGMTPNALTTTNGIKTETIASLTGKNLLNICASSTGNTVGPTPTCGTAIKLTDSAPALVFSIGKNANAGTLGPDESANTDNNLLFISHEQSSGGAGNEDYDDILSWLSSGVLISRMVSAGVLP